MNKAVFSILLFAATTFSARGVVVFNETFAYANGALTTVSAGVWTTFGGTAGQLDVAAGRAHLTGAETEDVGRGIGSVGFGAAFFYGFDIIVATSPPAGTSGNVIANLAASATGPQLGKVFVVPSPVAGSYRLGVANGATVVNVVFPADLLAGTTHRVVVRYFSPATGGPPQTTLWVDPCSIQSPSVTATDGFNPATLTALVLRQETGIGVLDLDNLRTASTFPEVGGDTNPPAITCPPNLAVTATSAAGAIVTFAVTATDDTDSSPTIVCEPPSGSTFPIGTTTVTCRAIDDCGNGSSCTFTVTVRLAPPLQMTCPADITVATTTPTGAVVNYPAPVVSGGCPPYTVACNPPSGSTFPIGSSLVTCLVTDSCTNRASCEFKVTVVRRFVEIDRMDYGLAQLTLTSGESNVVVSLAGTTTVQVFFDGEKEGDADDSDGNGRDDVVTQMVDMDLHGMSSMGPVQVTLDPTRPSMGGIEEGANFVPGRLDVMPFSPVGTADSFFDIFAEITVAGKKFHTQAPLHMQATIRNKPPAPGDTYINPFTQPIELLDENGNPTGIRVIREVHTPNPEKEIDVMDFGIAQLTLTKPDGGTEVVSVAGPTTVEVSIPPNGAAADTDGDGLDQVPTRMTSMDLRGMSSMGPVQVVLDPTRPTLGEIEETANTTPGILNVPPFAPGTANSFFDVFAEIHVGTGAAALVLHTAGPLHMQALIRNKPPAPGDTYVNPFTQPVPLLDANGRDTGIRIVREVHTPNPEKEIDDMPYGTAQVTLALPNGGTETVTLAGLTRVVVSIPPNGAAADTDGDGLDQVPTEMVSMDLRGNSSLGPVRATLDPTRPSLGEIEETANTTPGILNVPPFAPGTANSYFDVFPILTVGELVLHPAGPIRMQAIIHHKPPGPDDTYVNPFTQPVPLLDANGRDTGIRIIREVHTPNPPKEVDYFSYSQGKINIQRGPPGGTPSGPIERVIMAGPTQVEVGLNDATGLAADTDGDGLDQVPTTMTLLNLMGNSSMGPVMVSLDPANPSLGEIEEKVNGTPGVLDLAPFGNQGCANSYFNVRPIIKIGGLVLCPKVPLHIEAMICHKPPDPGDAYMNLVNQPPIELVDCATGQGTGIFIVGEMHTPVIPRETDYFSYSQGKINIQRGPPGGNPSGPIERVIMGGPTEVKVGLNDADGLAADTDGDGLDQVPTEMTLLNLMGNSSMGPVMVSLDPANPTLGEIEEKVNGTPGVLDLAPFGNQGCANSYFNVRPIIKIGGLVLCPKVPLHIEAMICHKPPGPGDAYMNLVNQPPIELVDCATGQGTGIFIVGEMHTPVIPRETDYFSYSQGKINIRHPDGHIERLIVAGPTEVKVGLNDADGLAADTDGDGLDQVPTEMTLLSLTGNSSLGPVMVSLNPARPTIGEIEEKVNGTPGVLDVDPFGTRGCGNSFFDVNAIITVGGRQFCPEVPLHIEAMICHKPPGPGEAYMNLVDQNIRLLDCASGQPTGFFITGEMHSPNPQKEIDNFPSTTAQVTVQLPTGASETVNLTGPTRVVVCIEPTGLAADTDADGRDQVPTEMTLLSLTGNSSLGPVQVQLNPARRSLGEIEETANATPGTLDLPPFTATGSADSFFDIFIEMRIGAMVLHNDAPIHMASVIHHKPPGPGDTYINPFTQPVPLLDANGNDTGIRIIREVHMPVPNCTNTITCPSNVVVWTCSPNGREVIYPAPIATGTCPPISITCVPPSSSNFVPGTTPVTCTSRDSLGNTVSCTFTVRVVVDTTPPVITCPSNIVIVTCNQRERATWTVLATDDCDTNVTVVCNPPSGTVFPIGVHSVVCAATDDCGHESKCEFRVEIRRNEAPPQLTIIRLPDNRIRICWSVSCTGWVLQCTRDLNPPGGWQPVTVPPTITGNQNCVILPLTGVNQFYRLIRRDAPTEIYSETDTLPPQGVYLAPRDEVTSILVPGVPGVSTHPILARWFTHLVPPPEIFPPRPPPCQTCPSDIFRWQTDVDFQVSLDDGRSWVDVHPEPKRNVSVAVQVGFDPQPDPPSGFRSYNAEILQLDGTFTIPGAATSPRIMVRESPTKASLGKTMIRESADGDGTFRIGSFFDVFIEVSLDGGQTWGPAQTPVSMVLYSSPAAVGERTDAFPPAGEFDSPQREVTRYANGLLARRFVYPIPPNPPPPFPPKPNPPCLTCPPATYQFSTDIRFEVSTDGGQSWMATGAFADGSVRTLLGRAAGGQRYFNTEMLQLDVRGGGGIGLPNLFMLRESPTRASLGLTAVGDSPSLSQPFRIGSFFDVFTEISLDGGQTWSPSVEATRVELNPQPLPPGQ